MRVRVGYAVAAALLCTLIVTPFVATEVKASTESTILYGEYTILVGEYTAGSIAPFPPPVPWSVLGGSYVFYNVIREVDGRVFGNPIDICVLDESNYQNFKNNQQYSVFQDLLNVNGSFNVLVVFPGPYLNYFSEMTNSWWIVFDNRAGSSNVTLHVDKNGETCPAIWVPLPSHDWALPVLVAMSAVLGMLFAVTRGERVQPSASKESALSRDKNYLFEG